MNQVDKNGNSPLSLAIEIDHQEMTACLIKAGADVSHKDNEGKSLVQNAFVQGHVSSAR